MGVAVPVGVTVGASVLVEVVDGVCVDEPVLLAVILDVALAVEVMDEVGVVDAVPVIDGA